MANLNDRRKVVENTPWSLLDGTRLDRENHYSGFILKAFRVGNGWNVHMMACQLGIKRVSALHRIENTDKIGIKRAKELAQIFKIPEYRIFRDRAKLEQYRPSNMAVSVFGGITETLAAMDILVLSKSYTVTEDGTEAVKVLVKTKKIKFPKDINGIALVVEKSQGVSKRSRY